MSITLSIHPQSYKEFASGERMRLQTRYSPTNAHCVQLHFYSMEANETDVKDPIWKVESEVDVYHLAPDLAFVLGNIGSLDAERMAELQKIVAHMLDVQNAEAEVDA